MGHALNTAIQDILVRKKRMEGFKTLWIPGTDHAGIATQNVVEKKLKKEGKTRFSLGREKFIKEIWQWKKKYGNIILDQLKKLGASCDWSRTVFTMDKDYKKAVREAFLHYWKKGLIYSGKRPINWCPRCQTSLSDLELEHETTEGKLWYINYPLKQKDSRQKKSRAKNEKFIVVATTRPETMLGDTAVAVNPKDKRYKGLIGRTAIVPIVDREIPIVADNLVNPEFGTGAVKVTPSHDLKDYEIGIKHNLPMIDVIDERGKMSKNTPGAYQGLPVIQAREKIIKELKKTKFLKKEEKYNISLPKCYRCGTTIEIIPSKQWFLKMDAAKPLPSLKKMSTEVVRSGKIRFYPKNFEKIYFNWMKDIRDWCISRQIWWGHRLPVWYCQYSEQKIKNAVSKMGFAGDVVSQVFDNKRQTYRLRNHNLKIGDKVAFENSATGEIFGIATIKEAKRTTVGKINLKDKKHWKTYNKQEELIAAFKKHYPGKKVGIDTPVWIYTYKFERTCPPLVGSDYSSKKCPFCKKGKLKQETDVLDTWFSSALWPFATLGWPKKKKDLKTFYPSRVLVTARDIINLWVARMIFSGLEFMKKIPFPKVLIHPTVLTKKGERMSKSLGTGVNPLDLVEKYGADATRFGLTWQITGLQDLRFDENNILMAKKFCNKIWNASRYVLLQIGNSKKKVSDKDIEKIKNLSQADKKILKSLSKVIKLVDKDLENFKFGQAAQTVYHFFWHDFCDNYIEKSKKQINKEGKEAEKTKNILLYVLLSSLKILHPFIPFITEEIYQKLPLKKKKKCLMIESWPKDKFWRV